MNTFGFVDKAKNIDTYLKPCPFCGSSDSIYSNIFSCSPSFCFEVGCNDCNFCRSVTATFSHTPIDFMDALEKMNEVIELWNTRPN